MRYFIAAAGLALGVPAVSRAATPASAATAIDDARCVFAFYSIAVLHDAKQGSFSDEGAKMARDGFLYYSGRLGDRTNDASLRSAVVEATKDKQADVKAIATSCLRRMGDQLSKTEEAVKSAVK
jgi:hypothetical protein